MASSLSSVITYRVVFTLTDFKVFVYFVGIYVFQSLCILLNAVLCTAHPLEPLFLYSVALKLKALSSVPHSRHPSLPLLLSFHCLLLCYLLHLTNSPVFVVSSVGRLLIEFSSQMTMERVQKENPNVTEGGRYTPPDCRPRWKVCTRLCLCVTDFTYSTCTLTFCYGSLFRPLKQGDDKKLCMIEIKIFMVSQNDEIVKIIR